MSISALLIQDSTQALTFPDFLYVHNKLGISQRVKCKYAHFNILFRLSSVFNNLNCIYFTLVPTQKLTKRTWTELSAEYQFAYSHKCLGFPPREDFICGVNYSQICELILCSETMQAVAEHADNTVSRNYSTISLKLRPI